MNPHARGTLRRLVLGTAAGAATLLTLAAPAGAGAPTRIDAEYWGVSCVADLGDGLTLFLYGGGTTDGAEGGIGAFVEDGDGSQVAEGQATSFAFGARFTTTVPLGGKTLVVGADATRGATTTEQVDERDGNSWTKGTATHADVALTGATASYGGTAVPLAENACSGEINGFHVRTTNPSATVRTSSDFGSDICDLEGFADGQVRVGGDLPTTYVEVVADHGGEDVEKAQGELTVRGGRGTLRTDLVDLFTGEVTTRATVELTLARTGTTERQVTVEGATTQRITVTPYRASIRVTTADGRSGTATCAAAAVTVQERTRPVR